MRSFRPVAALDEEGGVAGLLLWYRSPDRPGRWLECHVDALRAGLAAAPDAPIVGFVPDDETVTDVPTLVSAAAAALADADVAALLRPVTDAVKLVDGRRIVRGVDRSSLLRVDGPAFARAEVVHRALADAGAGTVRPLVATAVASRRHVARLDPAALAS